MHSKSEYANKCLWMVVIILLVAGTLRTRYGFAAEMDSAIDNPAPVGPSFSTRAGEAQTQLWRPDLDLSAPAPQNTFEGIDFDQNADLTDTFCQQFFNNKANFDFDQHMTSFQSILRLCRRTCG